eukprot:16115046-Heterocapsa_arctica.AAC.1
MGPDCDVVDEWSRACTGVLTRGGAQALALSYVVLSLTSLAFFALHLARTLNSTRHPLLRGSIAGITLG